MERKAFRIAIVIVRVLLIIIHIAVSATAFGFTVHLFDHFPVIHT